VFKSSYRVRMHDTDMAQVIFFASLFRIVHTIWEEILDSTNLSYHDLYIDSPFAVVVVHAEADYKAPILVGDKLDINVHTERIGTSSFALRFELYKQSSMVATALLIFATINPDKTRTMPLTEEFRKFLEQI
jgi:1,4-dihydroxy-2-naphthoyl-CoA hydrolase